MLDDLPNRFFQIEDETIAREFIIRLGISAKLTDSRSLAGNKVFVTYRDHPTHWILACRFHGFTNEQDNGYLVCGWPKREHPNLVMNEAIAMLTSDPGTKTLIDEDSPPGSWKS